MKVQAKKQRQLTLAGCAVCVLANLAVAETEIIVIDEQPEPVIETPQPVPSIPDAVMPAQLKAVPVTEPEPTAAETEAEAIPEGVEVNVVNVSETFYRIQRTESGSVVRVETQEAKPGDLIELVVVAENASSENLSDITLTNAVPAGPVTVVEGSIRLDEKNGLYRLSRNGETFFPSDAEIALAEVRFIQWVIFDLPAGSQQRFTYRIQVNR